MMKALICDNKVVQLAEAEFEVHPSMSWMNAPNDCEHGWVLNEGQLEAPPSEVVTEEELFLRLRVRRNLLLAKTDYLALSDVTLSAEMRTYRQALRDLPANTTDPANPVWPTKPGG